MGPGILDCNTAALALTSTARQIKIARKALTHYLRLTGLPVKGLEQLAPIRGLT